MSTCGCPSREVGFLLAIEAFAEHAVQLLMKRGCATKRFRTLQISHVFASNVGDNMTADAIYNLRVLLSINKIVPIYNLLSVEYVDVWHYYVFAPS